MGLFHSPLSMLHTPRWPAPLAHLVRLHSSTAGAPRLPSFARQLCTTTPTLTPRSTSFLTSYRLAVAVALPTVAIGLGAFRGQELQCAPAHADGGRPYAAVPGGAGAVPELDAPESILNVKEMTFGTVAGISVGIFVKKGLKMVAFALGGVFVLLQYLSSRSFITINWSGLTNSYDTFITKRAGPAGSNRVVGLWSWFIDFVSADVQGRATFIAGILLGFRLG